MNDEIDPIPIGDIEDIDSGTVENFEHEDIDYAIFHLENGFFATQGHCNCVDQSFICEGSVEEEEVDPRFFDFDFSSSFITMSLMASYDCAVSGISPKDCLFARPPDVVVAIRPFSRCCFEVDFEADDSAL